LCASIANGSRYLADYVVTEFGVAHLKGKSNNERARSLIDIAHPDFRADLVDQARKAGLMYGNGNGNN